MPRLRRADCSGPGLTRRGRGRGFEYLDERGRRIEDPGTLERIRALAIPPAWRDVWICADAWGHIQATGVDAAGRKQYLYHRRWRERRDQRKFDEMVGFARALPRMRARVARDLAGEDVTRERVLACAVRLLDRGFFRIGSEDYAADNGSYGLATMRKEHVSVRGDVITFDYPAKGGRRAIRYVVDPEVAQLVATLKRRRGGSDELLAYKRARRWVDLRSGDINAYLKDATGGEFSAKDFRTWNATVLAALALAVAPPAGSAASRKRAITRAVQEVAHYLGNTPAVCRGSYIDPRVFDCYRDGYAIEPVLLELSEELDVGRPPIQGRVERAVLDLLVDYRDSELVDKAA